MAKKTNCVINGKDYYRTYRKVGMKLNKMGIWVDDRKAFYGSCKKDAEEQYKEYMERIKSGSETDKCLGQIIDTWIECVFKSSNLSNSTKGHYIAAYKNLFQKSVLAGLPPQEVIPINLQEFYNTCNKPASTIRELHYFLRHFYRYAELNGICRDITNSLTPPRKQKNDHMSDFPVIDVWKDEDLQKVIAGLDNKRLRLLVVLAANTGCRLGELLAINTRYSLKDNSLYVSKQLSDAPRMDGSQGSRQYIADLKSSSSERIIPLSNFVMSELKKHLEWQKREMAENGYYTDYLFTTSKGTWYGRRNVTKSLKRLYKKINVPHHKFHAYRATFATNLCRAGVPIEETSKLLGHSDINMTLKYYVFVGTERKREAVEKITAFSVG